MSRPTHCWGVLLAAGVGQRMGAAQPKQYLKLAGRAILEHSLEVFCKHARIHGVVVALAPGDEYWSSLQLSGHPGVSVAVGGAERCRSALNGLERLATMAHVDDWVLVHDAARPCVTAADLECLITSVADHPVGGILAAPLRDTIKQVTPARVICDTLDRERLWQALTPQMFRLGALRDALAAAIATGTSVTDEAQALERQGQQPLIVECAPGNIKVSVSADLALAEFYLGNRGQAK